MVECRFNITVPSNQRYPKSLQDGNFFPTKVEFSPCVLKKPHSSILDIRLHITSQRVTR